MDRQGGGGYGQSIRPPDAAGVVIQRRFQPPGVVMQQNAQVFRRLVIAAVRGGGVDRTECKALGRGVEMAALEGVGIP